MPALGGEAGPLLDKYVGRYYVVQTSSPTLEYVSSESNADALAPLVSAHWYLTDGDTDSKIRAKPFGIPMPNGFQGKNPKESP